MKKKKIIFSLAAVGTFFFGILMSNASAISNWEQEGAEVKCGPTLIVAYYVDWDILTRSRLSEEYVRESFMVKFTIREQNRVNNIVRKIGFNKFKKNSGTLVKNIDVRLVIDIYDCAGKKTVFIADRFYLYFGNLSAKREINKIFMEAFEVFRSIN